LSILSNESPRSNINVVSAYSSLSDEVDWATHHEGQIIPMQPNSHATRIAWKMLGIKGLKFILPI